MTQLDIQRLGFLEKAVFKRARGSGAINQDLRRVTDRIRQGLSEVELSGKVNRLHPVALAPCSRQ